MIRGKNKKNWKKKLNAVKCEKINFRRYKTFSIKILPLGKNPEKPRILNITESLWYHAEKFKKAKKNFSFEKLLLSRFGGFIEVFVNKSLEIIFTYKYRV